MSHKEENQMLLTDVDGIADASVSSDEESSGSRPRSNVSIRSQSRFLMKALSVSILINLCLLAISLFSLIPKTELSTYAQLARSRQEPFVQVTPYAAENETLQDELWSSINIDLGVVALSDSWAADHGLRTAQRFPWDHSKGVYILHGFHNLHCLKIVHLSLSEYRNGKSQSRSWHHINHCMDALRRQIMCDADDTPRATERRKEVVSGVGQHRMCRDWSQLEEWARQHTACYKPPDDPEGDGRPIVDRFKHCPPGSEYVIDEHYVPVDDIVSGLPAESIDIGGH